MATTDQPKSSTTSTKQADPLKHWPGAFGIYGYSKAAVMFNIGAFAAAYTGLIIVSLVMSRLHVPKHPSEGEGYFFAQLVSWAISSLFSLTFITLGFASIRRQKIDAIEALRRNLPVYWQYFTLNLLLGLIFVCSLLALVIPFIVIMPRLIFAPYIMINQRLGISESLQASWDYSRGHARKVWGILGATIVMLLPVITFIGAFLSLYFLIMYSLAVLFLYLYIAKDPAPQKAKKVQP